MENWCYEKEALLIYAKHYKTGKALPRKFIEKIKKLKIFNKAYIRYASLVWDILICPTIQKIQIR